MAPGDVDLRFYNSTPASGYTGNYNYWTANGTPTAAENPGAASFPLVDILGLTAKTQILPAAGRRYASGICEQQGTYARYWSGTPSNSAVGYAFDFNKDGLYPVANWDGWVYAFGFSIRCVRP